MIIPIGMLIARFVVKSVVNGVKGSIEDSKRAAATRERERAAEAERQRYANDPVYRAQKQEEKRQAEERRQAAIRAENERLAAIEAENRLREKQRQERVAQATNIFCWLFCIASVVCFGGIFINPSNRLLFIEACLGCLLGAVISKDVKW